MKKKVTIAALLIFSISMFAQKDVTKFLGIPVDGTKAAMIQKLKNKGFSSSTFAKDVLSGEFNGTDVHIAIVTNNNKVWRIAVVDKIGTDERQIKIRFNKLCYQFQNNKNYDPSVVDYSISDDEDISFEMLVNNKQYGATFYQRVENWDSLSQKEMWDSFFKKEVWFKITEIDGDYYIMMFYDNNYNKANGEDL